MSGEIAIPEPRDASVAAVRELLAVLPALRTRIREEGSTGSALEMKRRLDALASYVGNREAKNETLGETRRTEVLLGELIEAIRPGERTDLQPLPRAVEVPLQDATRFRAMFAAADVVEDCIRRGIVTRRQVLHEIEEARRREDRDATRVFVEATPVADTELRVGDFRMVLADLEDVDAVITDPPYPREHLDLFTDLATWAADVLRDDGVLAVMSGQYHLPEVLARLTAGPLRYRWTAAILMPGAAVRIHPANLATQWKPLILLGGSSAPLGNDVFREPVTGADIGRAHHPWGQRTALMRGIIERLTREHWRIVDPFLGAGATALACAELGRDFTGCDIDPAAVQTTRERLAGAA